MRKVCSECGKEKDVWEFYDKYARCKQCTREDQNASNWYKPVANLSFEEWPEALQHYTIVRHEHMSQGRSVPAVAKDMVLAYQLSLGDDPDEPTEVSLPVVIALHRQVKELRKYIDQEIARLESLVDAAPKVEHATRTTTGELKNLHRSVCSEVDEWIHDGEIDPMDGADVKEGVRLINQAIATDSPIPAKGILDCVLTLAQLSLKPPSALEELYLKYYKPLLAHAEKPERQRVKEIAGVDLYEYDWLHFLNEE